LKENGFKLKPKKTKLCRHSVEFLGHLLDCRGILPLEKNLSGVFNFPVPTTVKQLRQFLGLINFYRRHIPNCSSIAKPLSSQTGGRKVTWTKECQTAFNELKKILLSPAVLAFPNYHEDAPPLELYVDASNIGSGAVLGQMQENVFRYIAFISMTFSPTQQRYSTIERELAALRWAVKSLRPFLCNQKKFIIYSDHEPLQYLYNMSTTDGRIARTLEELNEYNFEIKHVSGRKNKIADALSRSPALPEIEEDNQGEELLSPLEYDQHIPKGFTEIKVIGGGDSLFRCLALYSKKSEEYHLDVRVDVFNEIMKCPIDYGLHGRNILKKL